jgi:hypothetical protein
VWIVAENSPCDDEDAFASVGPVTIVDPAELDAIAMMGMVRIRALSPNTAQ